MNMSVTAQGIISATSGFASATPIGVEVIAGKENAEPASVAFDSVKRAVELSVPGMDAHRCLLELEHEKALNGPEGTQ